MSLDLLECIPCEDFLPEIAAEDCEPQFAYGEISWVLVGLEAFANIEDPAEHLARYSTNSTASSAIRKWRTIGGMSTEFGSDIEVGSLATIPGPLTLSVVAKNYDSQQLNYDAHRAFGCNKTYRVWPITSSGYIYGGNEGISMPLKGREVIPEDFKQLAYLEMSGKKTVQKMPLRDTYPLAVDL